MAQYYRANALYNYMPQDGSQITLTAGDTLQVYDTDSSGWWDGYNEMTGERGLFPSTYVELVEDQADYNYYNDPRQGGKGKKQPQYQPKAPSYQEDQYYGQQAAVPMGSNMNNYGKQSKNEIAIPLIEQKEEKRGGGGGGREGGGEKKKRDEKPSCPTRYGLYANQMARLNGISMFIVGIGCFVTAYEALVVMPNTVANTGQIFGLLQLGVFIYCTVVGIIVYLFETFTGGTKHSAFPTKAVVYTLLSGPLFITFFTLFNGVLFLISAYFHAWSFRLKEDVPAPKSESGNKEGGSGKCCACNYFEERTKAGKLGKDFFTYFFVACNLALFAVGLITVYPTIQPGGTLAQFTFMLPYAKGFGYALDFAASVILFPVSRTFIRLLYNYSTQDQTTCSRFLRSVLYLFPLDKALHFHEKTGYLILFLSYGHSFAHLVNAGLRFPQVVAFYGWSPLISGFLLWVCIFFMFPATVPVVKRGQFEIFWYSHQFFWAFFILNLIHGRGTLGPHYYYAFILPGAIYVGERIYREYSAYQSVSIISITNMKNNVLSIEFSKSAFPNGYLEGQYCYIQCPKISRGQWHPFTISSAPGDPTVTLHIKIQGRDSWTKQLLEYFAYLGPKNASYFEMADSGANGVQLGKVIGPTGERMLMVYGPHSAPTQHAPEYTCDIIVGSGIGVTPVSATMQQTVFYRWKYNIGDSNPDHAYFAWVCSYNEIETFRWMIRTVKECQDEVADLRLKNPDSMGVKTFEVHIWVTSIPDDVKPPGNIDVDDDIGYWGRPRKATGGVAKAPEQFSELEIMKTMLYPPKGAPAQLGDIRIYNGRPKWDVLFSSVAERHLACKIGVAFCGNPRIGDDLKEMCTKYTNPQANQSFTLHKENF